MTVDYLINLLRGCEYFKNFNISTGFLSEKTNSVSVISNGKRKTVRKYCDGSFIEGLDFSIIIRLASHFGDNAKNISFLEQLINSLPSLRLSKATHFIPLGIEVTKGPTLCDDNIHSLKYEINCRFLYLQEKEINI